ncbi:sulfatase [Flexithrix dorotheae]|uniref:sulfatase n=1 Tax=Flexithrix dorotheae TaxID=70993 RepID=UPI00036B3511|nr:sulfatase [Flexithrix dorotheae]
MKTEILLKIQLISIFTFLGFGSCTPKNEKEYNVILIVADDMNDYGFFNSNPIVKAPNIENFRKTAISFPYTYCAAPSCSPSRTAFLSGMSPHKSGKYYNGSKEWDKIYMQQQETMPEWFKRIGYHSYGKGKLFHSQISKDRVAQNFDGGTGKAGFGPFPDSLHQLSFEGMEDLKSLPDSMYNSSQSRFKGIQAFPDEDFPDVKNANEIIELLKTGGQKPFFLMYGLWRPHSPYTCPQRFYDMYDLDEIQIPAGYLENDMEDLPPMAKEFIKTKSKDFNSITITEQQWKAYLRGYYACYTFADYNIGRVLDALDKSEYAENTIVVITSDNGFHMGEKNRFDKNSLWELSAITPMAIRIPGSKFGGKICTKPVNLQDLYPTFVDYCGKGTSPIKPIDGHSIRPLLENPDAAWEHNSMTYFGKGWISIRSEQFRYLQYPDGTEELYNHKTDHWELYNMADNPKYRGVISKFRKQLPTTMAESIPGKWTKLIKQVEQKVMK